MTRNSIPMMKSSRNPGVLLATLTLLLEILPLTVVVVTSIKELLETLEELMLLVRMEVKGDVDDPLVVGILLMLVTIWAKKV